MALPITPTPQYPNVPNAPGVPPLVRQAGAVQSTVVALVSDGAAIASLFLGPQWGLFTTAGAPVFAGPTATPLLNNLASGIGLSGQSVLDVEYSQDQPISSAPQEQGAFVSYNKVQRPFTARVSYAVSGLQAFRTAFVQQAQALMASLDLIALIMPEFSFPSCNVVHWDFRRQERKPSLLVADFWVEQVRVVGTAAFSNTATASPSGADPANDGTVQSTPLTPPQTSSLPSSPSGVEEGPGTPSSPGLASAPSGTGGAGNSTVGTATVPYYDAAGNQIGLAPDPSPANGPVVGYSSPQTGSQPIIGGSWQNGFYDLNGTWIHP